MIGVAVAGTGHWGVNLVRNFARTPGGRLQTICDLDADRVASVAQGYPGVRPETSFDVLLTDDTIEAIVIALPAADHYEFARKALSAGKHALVEKPLSLAYHEAIELVELAEAKGLILFAGHTFQYNAAVNFTKRLIEDGELGDVFYVYSQRLNLGKVRTDVDAMWNLAPHDISILLHWFGDLPETVSATGHCHLQEDTADVVVMNLRFADGRYAHVHVSWLDPRKIRRMTVVGSKKMIVYDDVSPDRKIQIYDKGVDRQRIQRNGLGSYSTFGEFQLIQRAGDVVIPKIDFVEPLKVEAMHFLECIEQGTAPVSDGRSGAQVVAVLEAGTRSMKENGKPVFLSSITG